MNQYHEMDTMLRDSLSALTPKRMGLVVEQGHAIMDVTEAMESQILSRDDGALPCAARLLHQSVSDLVWNDLRGAAMLDFPDSEPNNEFRHGLVNDVTRMIAGVAEKAEPDSIREAALGWVSMHLAVIGDDDLHELPAFQSQFNKSLETYGRQLSNQRKKPLGGGLY